MREGQVRCPAALQQWSGESCTTLTPYMWWVSLSVGVDDKQRGLTMAYVSRSLLGECDCIISLKCINSLNACKLVRKSRPACHLVQNRQVRLAQLLHMIFNNWHPIPYTDGPISTNSGRLRRPIGPFRDRRPHMTELNPVRCA